MFNYLFLAILIIIPYGNAKNSFSVAPTKVEVDLSKPRTESFVVSNSGDDPIRVEASIIYFPVDSKDLNNGIALNPETSKLDSLEKNIIVSPRLVSLGVREQRVIRISVRPPADMKTGEYRAHILFQMLELSETQKKSIENAAGKKVGMNLSFKLEMAASVIGLNGIPDPKIKGKCQLINNKIILEALNPSVWRFDGWIQLVSEGGKILREEKNFVIRESQRNFTFVDDELKNHKKIKARFFLTKDGKAPLEVAECVSP